MLKQLVQLFAEMFLVSKKEWVSHQRNTDYSKSITLSLPNEGNYKQYVHHVMGCLSWRKAAQARCTLSATAETIGSTLIRNILTPIIKDYLYKLIRAKQYLIKPRPITEAASAVVNSSLLCQGLNMVNGGASC